MVAVVAVVLAVVTETPTAALGRPEASAIAPFEFTYILWAVVFGYLFWNEVPGPTTILGVVILVSSSLYIWYRERQIARKETALQPIQPAELAHQNQY